MAIQQIPWADRNHEVTWLLLDEAEKPENYVLMFGLTKGQVCP